MNQPDLLNLYTLMLRSRLYEKAVQKLWEEGKISGEMHMSTGEEAIMAGIISQLIDGDAMAVDHRGTAAFFMRGIDPQALLLEFLGHPQGICAGQGGHMHLFSKSHLAASSGIVGAAGPTAVGFALAAKYQKRENIAVAFFGDGAINQGMLLESFNLAVIWNLPVLFVCKDSNWAITTISSEVTGGKLIDRAKGFGIEGIEIDGTDPLLIWNTVSPVISKMRKKGGPYFLHIHCVHTEGHFLGDPLIRFHRTPVKMLSNIGGPLMKSVLKIPGASLTKRGLSLSKIFYLLIKSGAQLDEDIDPIFITQKKLIQQKGQKEQLEQLEVKIQQDIDQIVQSVLEIYHRRQTL